MIERGLFLLLLCLAFSCQDSSEWQAEFEYTGSHASPGAIDLNGDKVKDIVFGGGGGREWEATENAVMALNGKDGSLLWRASGRNQVIGSSVFIDINQDGTPDIVIGGRSAQLMALNGLDGSLIWEYLPNDVQIDFEGDTSILNFFSPQIIPDQNNDQLDDLLVSYGGFVKALPMDTIRPTGYLMVFSAANGAVLAKAPMPDGKETYMSPVAHDDGWEIQVFFGTGGETIGGHFYVTPLSDILDNEISRHHNLIGDDSKGFIAPPVLADLSGDGIPEVIVSSYSGSVYALEGQSYEILWSVDPGSGWETHAQPAPGEFTGDSTTDFFVNLGKGTWPDMHGALQIVIDGATGKYEVVDSVGALQYASPISARRQGALHDIALLPVNQTHKTDHPLESGLPAVAYSNRLYRFEASAPGVSMSTSQDGVNMGSTLLINDLDEDGTAELIYIWNHNQFTPFDSRRLSVRCFSLRGYTGRWNQYMGPGGKSRFP